MMKVVCTVWTGGKDEDSIKVLPISIDVYGDSSDKIIQGNTANIVKVLYTLINAYVYKICCL